MSDAKISALPAATTPLTGTEVLPLVQSSTTKKIATDDLTVKNIRSNVTTGILQVAGPGAATTRVMTTPNSNFTSARTDTGQTFAGDQSFSQAVIITGGITGHGASQTTLSQEGSNGAYLQNYGANSGTVGKLTIRLASSDFSQVIAPFVFESNGDTTLSTGNLVIGTAGKGIDFSAASHAAGMTSELLADYEEGTWTPADSSGAGLSLTIVGTSTYTKIGRQVIANCDITYPATADASLTLVGGLPFTTAATPNGAGSIGYTDFGVWITVQMQGSGTGFRFVGAGGFLTNALLSGKRVQVCATFTV